MAKVTVVCLIYIIVAATSLTSCFAARSLGTGLPSDKTDAPALSSTSRRTDAATEAVSTQFQDSSTTTKSDKVSIEHEAVLTDSDSEDLDLDDEMGPCVEGSEEDVVESPSVRAEEQKSEAGRACHRMLGDYGPPVTNKNPKKP